MWRILIVGAVSCSVLVTASRADDWGCKLLLCFANPSGWQSVPDCRPPVDAYLACANLLFGACPFPTCPEGGGSGLHYNPYDDCPAGSSPQARGGVDNHSFGVSMLDICVKDGCTQYGTPITPNDRSMASAAQQCSGADAVIQRPMRPKPFSIDIKDATTRQNKTYYFTLN